MNALVSRRSLLVAGAALAGAAVLAGVATLPGPGPGLRVLSAREAALVEAIAAALFPAGFFPVHGGDGQTAPEVDRLLAEVLDPATVAPFRYLLRAVEIGTLVSRGRTFTALPVEDALDVLDVWATDDPMPRRLAADSLQAVLGMAFLRRREVLARIGWSAGCH